MSAIAPQKRRATWSSCNGHSRHGRTAMAAPLRLLADSARWEIVGNSVVSKVYYGKTTSSTL